MSAALRLRPSVVDNKQRLAEGREKLRQRHLKGSPGIQVCAALTDLLDTIILDLFESAVADLEREGHTGLLSEVALVPHGGYGRRDVAPYSDVDLMLLYTPFVSDRIAPLAERMLRDVYDVGLTLGHSVRTPRQAVQLARKDAEIWTSLVEARYLAGSVTLFTQFARKFPHSARGPLRSRLAAVEEARRLERRQFGETVYLLEPNIKRSRGGLRDLHLLRWIGFASYGTAEPEGLQLQGVLSTSDHRALRSAAEFLLRLRNEMHFHAGKANDVLDRAEQVRVAAEFGFSGSEAMLPVEQFMQEYFRHTTALSNLVSRFVANARPGGGWKQVLGPILGHQVEGDFRVEPTQITALPRGMNKLQGDLAQVLRLADLANLYDKRISHATAEVIREALPSMSDDVSPEVAQRFLSLLSSPTRLGELLRELHNMRVLEKIVPAFNHARCLLQFNEYHKFTVDEHCIKAVEAATDFLHARGPLGQVYRSLKQKRLLHLALLIHDLGKGYPGDHSDVGLKIAEETAARLRMSVRDTEVLKFLVHKHLMMSHLAFRRDTSEDQLVVRFAVDVGSPDVLRMLYVLTAADLAAVGPGVLNDWKAEVLTELYVRTMQHLAGDGPVLDVDERLQRRRERIRGQLLPTDDRAWFDRQIDALPVPLLMSAEPAGLVAELRQIAQLAPGQVTAQGRYLPERRVVQYSVGTHESITAGVFHKLTGALAAQGLQTLSAEINTLGDGVVLDHFVVIDPDFAHEPPVSRLESVSRALVAALQSPEGTKPTFRRMWHDANTARNVALSNLPIQVRTDNDTSERYTIIDIFAADRTGLLYTITRTLFELGLSVSLAKIATHLDQVVDVFYVTDQQGQKINDEQRLQAIRERLRQEIRAFESR